MINEETRRAIQSSLLVAEDLLWAQSIPMERLVEKAHKEKATGFFGGLKSILAKASASGGPSATDPSHYAITSRRLLAVMAGGRLEQQMNVEDMESFVDLGNEKEFMVACKNDPNSERGFHFYFPENLNVAKDILFNKFGLK